MIKDTIKFLGEENFLRICREFNLEPEEIEVVRGIIKSWDSFMAIRDVEARQRKKEEEVIEAIKDLPPEKSQKIILALLEVSSLFAQFSLRRQ